MSVTPKRYFISSDLSHALDKDTYRGSYKFWIGEVTDGGDFIATYGRIDGNKTTEPPKSFGSPEAADAYREKKIKEKTKLRVDKASGLKTQYTEVPNIPEVEGGEISTGHSQPNKTAVASVAKKEIQHSGDPVVSDLIERLARANIHDIKTAVSALQYNDLTGLFMTPIGVILQQPAIDEARVLLDQMTPYVEKAKFLDRSYIDLLDKYVRIVPQSGFGNSKFDPTVVIPNVDALPKHSQILDALEQSIQMAEDRKKATAAAEGKQVVEVPRTFDVKLGLVESGKEYDRLTKKYKETRKDTHVCAHLGVRRAFTVEIATMKQGFEAKGRPLGTLKELWHGTKTANLLSIMRQGLIVPRGGSIHVTGRMYGDGLYFAIDSTKSLNYAYGYWDGSRNDNCFMFLADVALGKYCVPDRSGSNYPLKGYDSTWAQAGKSGIRNDEIIVPQLWQCNLTYLLEFTPGGK